MKRHLDRQIALRLSQKQEDKLKFAAFAYECSVSDLIRAALEPLFEVGERELIVAAMSIKIWRESLRRLMVFHSFSLLELRDKFKLIMEFLKNDEK
ncbi:MAG: hypothetical protein ACLP2P_08480 [Desulfobaccales bacterium]